MSGEQADETKSKTARFPRDSSMAKTDEYRQFAVECFRWADEAETEDVREAFLQMARDWTAAALRAEGVWRPEIPDESSPAA